MLPSALPAPRLRVEISHPSLLLAQTQSTERGHAEGLQRGCLSPRKAQDGCTFQPRVAEGSSTNTACAAVPGREDSGAVSWAVVPAGNLAQAAHEL